MFSRVSETVGNVAQSGREKNAKELTREFFKKRKNFDFSISSKSVLFKRSQVKK